ncbi:signal peptidase [Chryseobacterium arthrosphaerae]|uniref:Signal peptidase n=1 Tax=Chryseobacterium arthrosphaerae TaxID=651561 RepID=A0A1B8Z9R1_9FLAO|nr:signal peptidase [Chryseobacterium arthrosphaerae]AYZ10559.1 signal peptidase [Chryseobacterium arthrosphaerae]OCA68310.1 signal peptidase [Chryseobacterium arthrosphaerae]
MKTINKLVLAFFMIIVSLVNAETPPQPDVQPASFAGGGGGGNGTGAPASPIDMYVYILGIVAIAFIFYYTKKYKSVKA